MEQAELFQSSLAAATYARSEMNRLIVISLTQELSQRCRTNLLLGRITTPVLAMVLRREREIETFSPRCTMKSLPILLPPIPFLAGYAPLEKKAPNSKIVPSLKMSCEIVLIPLPGSRAVRRNPSVPLLPSFTI